MAECCLKCDSVNILPINKICEKSKMQVFNKNTDKFLLSGKVSFSWLFTKSTLSYY